MRELPNELRLQRLPLRALVAYASRCALRVLPAEVPRNYWQTENWRSLLQKTNEETATAAVAIRFSLQFASGRELDQKTVESAEQAIMRQMLDLLQRSDEHSGAAALLANCAYAAINAVCLTLSSPAMRTSEALAEETKLKSVGENVAVAAYTAADAAVTIDSQVKAAACSDFEILDLMQTGAFPQLGRAIDVGEKGPLGPLFKSESSQGSESWRDRSTGLQQVKKSESQLSELRALLQQERDGRKRDAEVARRDVRHAEKRIQELQQQQADQASRIQDLEQQLQQSQDEISTLRKALDESQQSAASTRELRTQFDDERKTWQQERDAWQVERDGWEEEREQWFAQSESWIRKIRDLNDAHAQLGKLLTSAEVSADAAIRKASRDGKPKPRSTGNADDGDAAAASDGGNRSASSEESAITSDEPYELAT